MSRPKKRGATYTVRTFTPADLRDTFGGRLEVQRSLRTSDAHEARLRALQWNAHVATLFQELRKRRGSMGREQIDALIEQYMAATFDDIDERLARDDWQNASSSDSDLHWRDLAQDLLAEQAEELERAVADNQLGRTLDLARSMLPGVSDGAQRILARRLLESQLEATMAELKAMQGQPLKRPRLVPSAASSAKRATPSLLLSEVVAAYQAKKKRRGDGHPRLPRQPGAFSRHS